MLQSISEKMTFVRFLALKVKAAFPRRHFFHLDMNASKEGAYHRSEVLQT
jgi:hypothetical protein